MSHNRLDINFDELRAELRKLTPELAADAGPIVVGAANTAKASMHYPRRTGRLADSVKVSTVSGGRFGAAAVVTNTSKLAHIFEHGSQARHTDIGASRGSMPPGNVFVPAVVRARRGMYEQLADLLRRAGLQVSGRP